MNEMQKFVNEQLGYELRVTDQNGDPWFVAKDVCDTLEIQNVTQAVAELDEDERAMFNIGRQGEANIISEAGLYSLILRSRKPEAKLFKRWITHDVLPSIRKHGAYVKPNVTGQALDNREVIRAFAAQIIRDEKRINLLEGKEEVFGNRTPFGIPSEETGLPRTVPVRGYLRSGSRSLEFVPDVIQLSLFNPLETGPRL